jgi:hypothetical protein
MMFEEYVVTETGIETKENEKTKIRNCTRLIMSFLFVSRILSNT